MMTTAEAEAHRSQHMQECLSCPVAGITFELSISNANIDWLTRQVKIVASRCDFTKIGVSKDLIWRFYGCQRKGSSNDMEAYWYNGYSNMFALTCQYSRAIGHIEAQLIKVARIACRDQVRNVRKGNDGALSHGAPVSLFVASG